MVINLVLNGCEAMEEMQSDSRQLVLQAAREGIDEVQVSVEDSGGGFQGTPPEELFEPFKTSKESGLGMGLSISRRIIENHGGRIWCCENPGGGATFHFTLPTAMKAEQAGEGA